MGYKQKVRETKRVVAASASGRPLLMDASPDMIVSSIVDIFKKVGSCGGGPPLSAILMHELIPGSVLKDGYGVIEGKFCFYNVWVAVGDDVYDPGTKVLKALNLNFDETVELGNDEKGARIDDEPGATAAKTSLESYLKDPVAWWKNAPPGYARVRKFVMK